MDFLKKYNLTLGNVLKFVGIAIGAIIIVALLSSLFRISFSGGGIGPLSRGGGISLPFAPSYNASSDSAQMYEKGMSAELSVRNVVGSMPVPPYYGGGTSGNNAEDFEVTDYNATIETRKLEQTCEVFTDLKAKSYVIFENANESDRNCGYTFKVLHANVAEVLAIIKQLDPKDLSESTYTIKRQIDDFTSEEDILKKKLTSIDDTLKSALNAYQEITVIATRTGNAEALAKIIDSKIGIIERLTVERINTASQLDRLARAKDDQLDRLKYTRFNVNVYENKYFDGEQLKDSWKQEIRNLVNSINLAIQFVTLRLLAFLLWLLPIIIYVLVLVIVAKYGWKLVQSIWKK